MYNDFTSALVEEYLTEAAYIDFATSKLFWNGLKANPAYIDVESFHKAYDKAIEAEGLSGLFDKQTGLLMNRGTYGSIKNCQNQDLARALKRFWAAQYSDYLKTKAEIDKAANRVNELQAELDAKIAAVFPAILDGVAIKCADKVKEYLELVGKNDISEIISLKAIVTKSEFNSSTLYYHLECRLEGYNQYYTIKDTELNKTDYIVRLYDSLLSSALLEHISKKVNAEIADFIKGFNLDERSWDGLFFVDKDNEFVYKIEKENGKYNIFKSKVGDISFDGVSPRDCPDLTTLKLVAANYEVMHSTGRCYYHYVYNYYYNPEIDQAIGKTCHIEYEESEGEYFDNSTSFLADDEIPASMKALGLTKGERHSSECDSSD